MTASRGSVEGLVVFDRPRGRQGLKRRDSEVAALEAHAQGSIEKVEERDIGAAQRHACPGRLDGVAGRASAEGERLGERAFFAARQGLGEIGFGLLTPATAGDAAEALYRSLGYALAGRTPLYARDAMSERYDATRIMYKDLRGG